MMDSLPTITRLSHNVAMPALFVDRQIGLRIAKGNGGNRKILWLRSEKPQLFGLVVKD